MLSSEDITLTSIAEKNFYEIAKLINNETKYVSFYNPKDTNAIILDGKIIGLFSLNKFIEDNLTIHIALLEQYRNKGIGQIIFNKIVIEYGKNYPESEFFLANVNFKNETCNSLLKKINWTRTHKYDEIMYNEVGNFYIIYEKENPYYNKKNLNRKVIKL